MTLWTIAGVSGTSAMIVPPEDAVPFLDGHMGPPFLFRVKRRDMDTAVDIGTAGLCDLAQWSLNSVEDICQDARGKGDRHWSSGSGYDLAGGYRSSPRKPE